MKDRGYIKDYRSKLDWEWFTCPETAHFFEYCTLKATHKKHKWQGVELLPGQFIAGRKKMSVESGLSERAVRTCIKRLTQTGEIEAKATSRYSIVTVCNWDTYQFKENASDQPNDQQNDQQVTNERPASDQQATTDKNDNNYKNGNNLFAGGKDEDVEKPDYLTNDQWSFLNSIWRTGKTNPNQFDAESFHMTLRNNPEFDIANPKHTGALLTDLKATHGKLSGHLSRWFAVHMGSATKEPKKTYERLPDDTPL